MHRETLPHLIANPVGVSVRNDLPVRNLVRRLVENPVMLRHELEDDERRALSRDRGGVERAIESLFGLRVETRSEGVLLWGDGDNITGEAFPGIGAARQASLLFIAEVVQSGSPATDGWIHLTRAEGAAVVEQLLRRHEGMWRTDFNPETPDAGTRVLTIIADTLSGLGLLAASETGFRLSPASARYRPAVHHYRPVTPELQPSGTVSLFDDFEES